MNRGGANGRPTWPAGSLILRQLSQHALSLLCSLPFRGLPERPPYIVSSKCVNPSPGHIKSGWCLPTEVPRPLDVLCLCTGWVAVDSLSIYITQVSHTHFLSSELRGRDCDGTNLLLCKDYKEATKGPLCPKSLCVHCCYIRTFRGPLLKYCTNCV